MNILRFIELIPDKVLPRLEKKSKTLYISWREICHIIGSFILITFSVFVSSQIRYDISVVIFIFLTIWMTYQEFYLHPKKYNQKLWKGIIDWLSWILPFMIYLISK